MSSWDAGVESLMERGARERRRSPAWQKHVPCYRRNHHHPSCGMHLLAISDHARKDRAMSEDPAIVRNNQRNVEARGSSRALARARVAGRV